MLTHIFCEIDDFCREFESIWNQHLIVSEQKRRLRQMTLSMSEIMTIIVYFHLSNYRHFKGYYTQCVMKQLRSAFPDLVSYNRFVELKKSVSIPLAVFLNSRCIGAVSGISFIDSTPLKVCHNLRINNHKVFKGVASRGKTSVGWFYGFKTHLVVSDSGELLSAIFTRGNVDDRDWRVIDHLTRKLFGKLFGDRGYISQKLAAALRARNVELITRLRKNMKNQFMSLIDKILLRKRAIIESIIDFLKNICQIEHTRHRSIHNFSVNLMGALIAYSFLPKKPSLKLNKTEIKHLQLVMA